MSEEQNDELQAKGAALVDGNAQDVIAAIPDIQDPEHLQAALDAEAAGKARVTVVAALQAAITPPLQPEPVPDGYVALDAPDGAGLVSWGGNEYAVENGSVQVPAEAIADLLPHGFSLPKPKKGKAAEASA